MCGLVLNRVIPHQSILMNRTVFIGNSIFIPFFLIYIGMLVDVRAFFDGFDTLILAAALIIIALFGKYLAALATQLIYRYTKVERILLFGLSSSRAAATIAVVIVGYRIGIFDENIINAAVLIILFTCLVSSYVTDYAGRMVALQQEEQGVQKYKSESVLVPVSNPDTALSLFNFAILIHQPDNNSRLLPLSIATTARGMEDSILHNPILKTRFIDQANAANVQYLPIMRIDSNISEGITHAAVEVQATHIVMGWSGQSGAAKYFFGTIIEKLLESCPQTLMVVNLKTKMLKFHKIYVLIPSNADHEIGFQTWMHLLIALHHNTSGELLLFTDKQTYRGITRIKETVSFPEKYFHISSEFPSMKSLASELDENDLFVVISARPNTVSYNRKLPLMPRVLTRFFGHTNSMILYPEQMNVFPDKLSITFLNTKRAVLTNSSF